MALNAPEQPRVPRTGYWTRPLRHPDEAVAAERILFRRLCAAEAFE
jgi:hypothetical protein